MSDKLTRGAHHIGLDRARFGAGPVWGNHRNFHRHHWRSEFGPERQNHSRTERHEQVGGRHCNCLAWRLFFAMRQHQLGRLLLDHVYGDDFQSGNRRYEHFAL